jgi:long-chain acyl-CoA synthetase
MIKKNLIELAIRSLKKYDTERGLIYTKSDDTYDSISRRKLFSDILTVFDYLKNYGIKPDDKIAIISENRTEWIICDFASMLLRSVTVPIYTTLSSESIKYILKDSAAKICIVSNNLYLDKVLSIESELHDLKMIVTFSDTDRQAMIPIMNIKKILSDGKERNLKEVLHRLEQISGNINENDLLTIIYTSGTTGVPKGVMLSHKNVYSNVLSISKVLPVGEDDLFLSYLPYSHIYERTAGYYFPFFVGAKIYYAQSIDTIGLQMAEVKPTVVITVPRLLDKIYNKLIKNYEEMPASIKKKILGWAINVAKSNWNNKDTFKWKLANKLVYTKIREKTGGRLRLFVSGGGALNKRIGEFFEGIGILTLEGYGMTEASPVISVNRAEKNKYGTVGTPLEGVSVKIADDGEILVKGDLVMKGYFNNKEETDNTIVNGWLHTGDIGEKDEDGYIRITDRKKSLFKSSGGKYIAPAHIEEIILQLSYVDQVLVIGNNRMYVTALIVPEITALKDVARNMCANVETESELFQCEAILKKITSDLNEVQKDLAPHEKVRKFTLLEQPFTIERGELTPTLKIKRKVVEEKFSNLIEKMYLKV